MEDVLLTYLQSRKRNTLPAESASSRTGDASWSSHDVAAAFIPVPGADRTGSEVFPRPGLPYPLGDLFSLVDSQRDYAAGCRELAAFLSRICDRFPLDSLLSQALEARFPRVWLERFCFLLLDVRESDWQTSAYVLQFRHLKRLLQRVERRTPLNVVESSLARELIQALSLSRHSDFDPFCRLAAATFQGMRSGNIPVSGDLGLVVYLIRCECTAMGERKNWLESHQDGEPDAVARLSPHLLLLEERMRKSQELAQRLGGYGSVQDVPIGMETAMGSSYFSHLVECLDRNPSLAPLRDILELQRAKRIPTRDLISLSTLGRWFAEARGASAGPLEWIRLALQAYDRGHFRLDVADGLPAVESLLAEAKVERDGSIVIGNFGEYPYASWIARDGLTRPYRSSNPDRIIPSLSGIVAANMHRETVLLKMLDNPQVTGTPGLVESMVEASLSGEVHAKIAGRRDLHSGPANGRVPAALLRSAVSIPLELLRGLIDPDLVPFPELKSLYRSRSALRREVSEELRRFLLQTFSA